MLWPIGEWQWYLLFVVPPFLLGLWAQARVKGSFARFSQVRARSGMSGFDAAKAILQANDLYDMGYATYSGGGGGSSFKVGLGHAQGKLSDHYDPTKRMLNLSGAVGEGRSLASVGIAAHEAGHAIQHARGYLPLKVRHAIYPVVAVANYAWQGLMGLGFFLYFTGIMFSPIFIQLGVIVFAIMAAFSIITLPVEFNASRRALALLTERGIITQDEVSGVKKVLNAAALTYVAGTLMAIGQLMYFLMLARGRN